MSINNVTPRLRERLAETQNGFCPACGYALPDDLAGTEVDHIIPRARGGPNVPWNKRLIHFACNRSKKAKLTDAARNLAELHGVVLREPRPTSWPGSTRTPGGSRAILGGEPLLFGGEDEATIAYYRRLVELAQASWPAPGPALGARSGKTTASARPPSGSEFRVLAEGA